MCSRLCLCRGGLHQVLVLQGVTMLSVACLLQADLTGIVSLARVCVRRACVRIQVAPYCTKCVWSHIHAVLMNTSLPYPVNFGVNAVGSNGVSVPRELCPRHTSDVDTLTLIFACFYLSSSHAADAPTECLPRTSQTLHAYIIQSRIRTFFLIFSRTYNSK